MKARRIIIALVLLCGSYTLSVLAEALPFFYEPFDYPDGTRLAVQQNWTYSGSGAQNIHTNVTGSLWVNGLASPSGNKVMLGQLNNASATHEVYTNCWQYGQASRGQSAYDLFCSFIVEVFAPFAGPDVISTNCVALNQSQYNLVNFRRNANIADNYDIGISRGKTQDLVWDANGGNGYLTNTPYLLVMSMDLDATTGTTADGLKLWINPSYTTFAQDTPPVASTLTTVCDSSDSRTKRFSLYATASPAPAVYVDEVRMGTNWAAVTPVPEPALLGLLALLPLLRRR